MTAMKRVNNSDSASSASPFQCLAGKFFNFADLYLLAAKSLHRKNRLVAKPPDMKKFYNIALCILQISFERPKFFSQTLKIFLKSIGCGKFNLHRDRRNPAPMFRNCDKIPIHNSMACRFPR